MMQLRSSWRCCNRPIVPVRLNSRSMSLCSGSATNSGIVILRDRVLHAFGEPVEGALDGEVLVIRDFGDLGLNMLGWISVFQLQLTDLLMDLALELIAGLFELSHELAPGARHFR